MKAEKKLGIIELKRLGIQVRRDIIRMVFEAKSGHPGGSLGCVEYFLALYFHHLKHNPAHFQMDGIGEGVFILSNGHITPVYYSVLARSEYFDKKELSTFRKINSRLQGHPATAEGLPGIRIATGSLGQGLSVALGVALAKKLNNDNHLVYALIGDGEVNEGQIWEAAQFASHHKIDNIIVAVDRNNKQIDGDTREIMDTGDLAIKFTTFGWEVIDCYAPNDIKSMIEAIKNAKKLTRKRKPVMLILHTIMGKGVDFMEDTHEFHGKPPNNEQFERAMAQLKETEFGDY